MSFPRHWDLPLDIGKEYRTTWIHHWHDSITTSLYTRIQLSIHWIMNTRESITNDDSRSSVIARQGSNIEFYVSKYKLWNFIYYCVLLLLCASDALGSRTFPGRLTKGLKLWPTIVGGAKFDTSPWLRCWFWTWQWNFCTNMHSLGLLLTHPSSETIFVMSLTIKIFDHDRPCSTLLFSTMLLDTLPMALSLSLTNLMRHKHVDHARLNRDLQNLHVTWPITVCISHSLSQPM